MSAVVTATPAGIPSRTAIRAGPCDSPAVSQRNMRPSLSRTVALRTPPLTRAPLAQDNSGQEIRVEPSHRLIVPSELPNTAHLLPEVEFSL